MKFKHLAIAVAGAVLPLAACTGQGGADMPATSGIVSTKGEINLPEGFELWPTLGAWATASGGENAPVDQLHTVYVSPGAIESYQKTGKFADGTVLVKEVRDAKASLLTTGNAHWPTDTKVWFVMVKDSSGQFEDQPLWSEGWGWALFQGDDRTKQVAESFESSCQACHQPAKDTDWIYSDAYPVLRSSAGQATPAWDVAG